MYAHHMTMSIKLNYNITVSVFVILLKGVNVNDISVFFKRGLNLREDVSVSLKKGYFFGS